MDYAKAKAIRGTSLSSLLTDKLVSGKEGVGKSIRSAVSEKMSAKMIGFKEKFDPLNIARAMTGGSGLAPALLGRMTGRSKESISYFAGGKKATKIPADLSGGSGLGDAALEVLSQMFDFMKKSYENNKKRSELQDTFREEKINEEQERHDDFLEILKQYTSLDGDTKKTAKKEEGGFLKRIMDFIKNSISGVFAKVNGLIDDAIGFVKGLINDAISPFKWLLGLGWLKALAKFDTLADIAKALIKVGPFASIFKPALLVAAAGAAGYIIGTEIVAPTLDAMVQFHTGDKTATLGTWLQGVSQKLFGGPDVDKKMRDEDFDNIIKQATKNGNRIEEEKKEQLLRLDWVKDDPAKVTQLNQLTVIPKVNISREEQAGQPLLAEGFKGTVNIGVPREDAVTGIRIVPFTRIKREPLPPPPVVDAIDTNVDLVTQQRIDRWTTIAPIVTNKVNNSSSAAKPVSAAASQRDDTSILDYVFGGSTAKN
jgi:hypothetical protein